MSSFPDVLSAELSYDNNNVNPNSTFTVPALYAFAAVQVCLRSEPGAIVGTSHGNFSYDPNNGGAYNTDGTLKDLPILNLIIKGGESFSLNGNGSTGGSSSNYIKSWAKVTALCHKKPS